MLYIALLFIRDSVCQAGSAVAVVVPQGSVLGPLLFAVYCSLVGDIITDHGVHYYQYTDDMQLHLAMSVDNTAAGLSTFAVCTANVKQ